MTADADWIDDLERKAKAATPGPWYAHGPVFGPNPGAIGQTWGPNRRNDAKFTAAADPTTILHLIEELRKATRAAQTLGKVIEDQNRDALNATGLHHLIDEDGDGDWGAVWDNLAEIAAERDQWREMYQAQVHLAHVSDMKVAAVEALADETEQAGDPLLRLDRLRAALTEGDPK